jgi:hypothetical protein
VALRYEKEPEEVEAEKAEQYQLFATSGYTCRVFVTSLEDPIELVVWFYNKRAGAENLIKEANNDAGLAAHPSKRFDVNGIHFQLAMLAYNLNCCRPQASTMVHLSGDKAWPVCFAWANCSTGRRKRT